MVGGTCGSCPNSKMRSVQQAGTKKATRSPRVAALICAVMRGKSWGGKAESRVAALICAVMRGKSWGQGGIEPPTSRTLSENHATRPLPRQLVSSGHGGRDLKACKTHRRNVPRSEVSFQSGSAVCVQDRPLGLRPNHTKVGTQNAHPPPSIARGRTSEPPWSPPSSRRI